LVGDDVDVGVVVNPENGAFIVHVPDVPDGAVKPLTGIQIESSSPIFVPGAEHVGTLDGPFDSLTLTQLVKRDSRGFSTINFGPILRPGVGADEVESLIQVTGTFDGGAPIASFKIAEFKVVPEPTCSVLPFVAAAACGIARRRPRRDPCQ
ncbi:MAG: hypothetical protein KDB27_31010, partial [Planctomycetales bacterium]|nr:hypothetical protein [Planctomycetales bacterium]